MLAAFAWTAWAFAAELRARVARAQPPSALLALAVTAGLVGIAVQGLIDTMSIAIFGLWLPAMGLALAAAAATPLRGPTDTRQPLTRGAALVAARRRWRRRLCACNPQAPAGKPTAVAGNGRREGRRRRRRCTLPGRAARASPSASFSKSKTVSSMN